MKKQMTFDEFYDRSFKVSAKESKESTADIIARMERTMKLCHYKKTITSSDDNDDTFTVTDENGHIRKTTSI